MGDSSDISAGFRNLEAVSVEATVDHELVGGGRAGDFRLKMPFVGVIGEIRRDIDSGDMLDAVRDLYIPVLDDECPARIHIVGGSCLVVDIALDDEVTVLDDHGPYPGHLECGGGACIDREVSIAEDPDRFVVSEVFRASEDIIRIVRTEADPEGGLSMIIRDVRPILGVARVEFRGEIRIVHDCRLRAQSREIHSGRGGPDEARVHEISIREIRQEAVGDVIHVESYRIVDVAVPSSDSGDEIPGYPYRHDGFEISDVSVEYVRISRGEDRGLRIAVDFRRKEILSGSGEPLEFRSGHEGELGRSAHPCILPIDYRSCGVCDCSRVVVAVSEACAGREVIGRRDSIDDRSRRIHLIAHSVPGTGEGNPSSSRILKLHRQFIVRSENRYSVSDDRPIARQIERSSSSRCRGSRPDPDIESVALSGMGAGRFAVVVAPIVRVGNRLRHDIEIERRITGFIDSGGIRQLYDSVSAIGIGGDTFRASSPTASSSGAIGIGSAAVRPSSGY